MKRGRRKYAKYRYQPSGGWAGQRYSKYGVSPKRSPRPLTAEEQLTLIALFDGFKAFT